MVEFKLTIYSKDFTAPAARPSSACAGFESFNVLFSCAVHALPAFLNYSDNNFIYIEHTGYVLYRALVLFLVTFSSGASLGYYVQMSNT